MRFCSESVIIGEPEDNFTIIGYLWSEYFKGIEDPTPCDVAIMMMLFKIGRLISGGYKHDTLTDIIGYAACAEELASKIGCHYQKGETLHNTCNDDRDEEPKEEKP